MVSVNLFLIKYENKPFCAIFHGRRCSIVALKVCCGEETTTGVGAAVGV